MNWRQFVETCSWALHNYNITSVRQFPFNIYITKTAWITLYFSTDISVHVNEVPFWPPQLTLPFARTAVFGIVHFIFPAFLVDLPEDRITCLKQNMLPFSRHQPSSCSRFLPCFPSRNISIIHAVSWAANMAAKSWNNRHLFEWQLMLLTQQWW